MIRMNFYTFCFALIAGCVSCTAAELYVMTAPRSIKLAGKTNTIKLVDVPQVINFLMGLPARTGTTWKDLESADLFNRPKANLFINVYVPEGIHFTIAEYITKYQVESFDKNAVPSMEETNHALDQLFDGRRPIIVDFEADGEILSTASRNSDLFENLPSTLAQMRERLTSRYTHSVATDLGSNSCLSPLRDADAYFLGELQTLADILTLVAHNKSVIEDIAPDSYYFSLTALDGLTHAYGLDSCQVKTAVKYLQKFLPEYITAFNTIYDEKLLSEVNVVHSNYRSFDKANVRRTRSLQQATDPTTDVIGNIAVTLPPDYPVVVNIAFWSMVAIALAVLAVSYFIWYMDPGRDNIVYRMTTQRMKVD